MEFRNFCYLAPLDLKNDNRKIDSLLRLSLHQSIKKMKERGIECKFRITKCV